MTTRGVHRVGQTLCRRAWCVIAVSATLAASCGADDGAADPVAAAAQAAEAAMQEGPAPKAGEAMQREQPERLPASSGTAVFNPDAPPLIGQFQPIEPGEYRVDTLGAPFTITVPADWWVQPNTAAFTVFTHPRSRGPGDRDVVFIRPTVLADPDQPTRTSAEMIGWPVGDIEGWLDNLYDGLVISGRTDGELGGRPALVFDVALAPDAACGTRYCVGFVEARGVQGKSFDPGLVYRVYWVDGGDHEPVAVVIGDGGFRDDWFAEADALLATVAFGEPGPHPIPAVASG